MSEELAKANELRRLLAATWFYGGWVAETYNEREMERNMREAGFWPTTEDEIIARSAAAQEVQG